MKTLLNSRTIEFDPWPFAGHPRVLIEHPDPDVGLKLATALRRAGCTVTICRGPDAEGHPTTRCPLHDLAPCSIVEGADVVLTALDFDEHEPRAVLHGLRTRYPGKPLVVVTAIPNALELADELQGCTVLAAGIDPVWIVAAVRRAAALTGAS